MEGDPARAACVAGGQRACNADDEHNGYFNQKVSFNFVQNDICADELVGKVVVPNIW